jgi:hypothetical protein
LFRSLRLAAGGALSVYEFAHHLFGNRSLSTKDKQRWALGFFLGAPIAAPLYWYRYRDVSVSG